MYYLIPDLVKAYGEEIILTSKGFGPKAEVLEKIQNGGGKQE